MSLYAPCPRQTGPCESEQPVMGCGFLFGTRMGPAVFRRSCVSERRKTTIQRLAVVFVKVYGRGKGSACGESLLEECFVARLCRRYRTCREQGKSQASRKIRRARDSPGDLDEDFSFPRGGLANLLDAQVVRAVVHGGLHRLMLSMRHC